MLGRSCSQGALLLASRQMKTWLELVEMIIRHAPNVKRALGKTFLYDEAKLAHPTSTTPSGASPAAAMLLLMAARNDMKALAHADQVFHRAHDLGARRLRELKGAAALNGAAGWQALSELSMLHSLSSDGQPVSYDETIPDLRTPDFRRWIAGEDLAIEHVAAGGGTHMESQHRRVNTSLTRARGVFEFLDVAKAIANEYPGAVPPATPQERIDLALANGQSAQPGLRPPAASDEDILSDIQHHEVKPVRVLVGEFYVVSRFASVVDDIRYLREIKGSGSQADVGRWKVLALSLPETLYPWSETEELRRFSDDRDASVAKLKSGTVWHALLGKRGTRFFNLEHEHLARSNIRSRMTHDLQADGLLVDPLHDWHAAIVSVFPSTWHDLESPASGRQGIDIVPLSLVARRALFLRTQGEGLPDSVISALCSVLSISEIRR